MRPSASLAPFLLGSLVTISCAFTAVRTVTWSRIPKLEGWVQKYDGEWEWEEDDPDYEPVATFAATSSEPSTAAAAPFSIEASATPQLPSKSYKPKQSLGQNYLKDPNTVAKIVRAFHADGSQHSGDLSATGLIELGPGAGALTDKLIEAYGVRALTCIEIDPRSVQLLRDKHPLLDVRHEDVLQVDYGQLAAATREPSSDPTHHEHRPLVVIGNLPYYITSQILFALADASHVGAVASATVTMQWEVAQRMVARPNCKDYGILSVVFQLYADVRRHFKIPPTVFYPQPKVDSALVGLHFVGPEELRRRLGGVSPSDLRRVVTAAFQQRRKTLRNSLKKLALEQGLDPVEVWNSVPPAANDPSSPPLPPDWVSLRPEQLTPVQFVQVTRHLMGAVDDLSTTPLPGKCWRKLKHGSNDV